MEKDSTCTKLMFHPTRLLPPGATILITFCKDSANPGQGEAFCSDVVKQFIVLPKDPITLQLQQEQKEQPMNAAGAATPSNVISSSASKLTDTISSISSSSASNIPSVMITLQRNRLDLLTELIQQIHQHVSYSPLTTKLTIYCGPAIIDSDGAVAELQNDDILTIQMTPVTIHTMGWAMLKSFIEKNCTEEFSSALLSQLCEWIEKDKIAGRDLLSITDTMLLEAGFTSSINRMKILTRIHEWKQLIKDTSNLSSSSASAPATYNGHV